MSGLRRLYRRGSSQIDISNLGGQLRRFRIGIPYSSK
jgi:hypothetical protein